jgi:hypothetical protein
MRIHQFIGILVINLVMVGANAATDKRVGDIPEAVSRTNGQNYKDMMLAGCISRVYEKDVGASKDASSTATELRDLTVFQVEESAAAVEALITQYLKRDYHDPMEGYEGVQFKLLKCLDMYHSKALDKQVRKYVDKPNWIGKKPAPKGKR